MADLKTVKIVGGPTTMDLRLYTPDGEEIPNVTRLEFDPVVPGKLIQARIESFVTLDLKAELIGRRDVCCNCGQTVRSVEPYSFFGWVPKAKVEFVKAGQAGPGAPELPPSDAPKKEEK